MKTLLSLVALFVSFTLSVQAGERKLFCELAELDSGRILLQSDSAFSADKGIQFLFSQGAVTGTVNDRTEATGEHNLELELSYHLGSTGGVSHSERKYRPDQRITAEPLSEATLQSPDVFTKDLSLRCFLREALPALPSISSTTTYEYGNGNASGWCDGMSAYFCVDQIKRRAHDDATRDAQWHCEMRRGRADTFSASCSDFCNPAWIPSDAPSQSVSCSANCTVRCELP